MNKFIAMLVAGIVLASMSSFALAEGEQQTVVTGVPQSSWFCVAKQSAKCPGNGCVVLRVQKGQTGWTTPGSKYCYCGRYANGGCLAGVSRNGKIHLVYDAAVTAKWKAAGGQTFCH